MKPKLSFALRALLLAIIVLGAAGWLPQAAAASSASSPTLGGGGGGGGSEQQVEGLTMKATASYKGYFKYGEWLPVWVELENQGRDLDGEVRVQVSGSQGTLVFSAPVSLPSGSHKRVPVYVLPNNFSRELDIRLVSGDKILLTQKATVRPQPNISYFIGILSPERGALALLNGVKFTGQERPKILVDLSVGELPERAETLRSFDLLIVNDTDTSKLTPQQAAALAGWVQQGGRLVIGGGTGAQKTAAGLPANLLPLQVSATGEVDEQALAPLAEYAGASPIQSKGPYIAAWGEAKNSRALVSSGTLALLRELAWGTGEVDFVAFDVSGLPFDGWPGTLPFWQTLIGQSGAFPDGMPFDVSMRQMRANSLVYPLSNIPSLDLPSIQGLGILLAIYVIIVGPLNYLVLRWRKSLHLAWVSIPLITALFTAGAFGIGYAMRGNDLILNKLALVEARPDGTALVTSYIGLFSPRMQSYEVSVQGESLLSPMSMDQNPFNSAMPAPTGGEMIFVQGQPARVKGLTVNQFAMQSFMSEGTWQNFGKISGNLRIENDTLVGSVRNDTGYTLTDAVLVMQSRFARLGDLEPGEEQQINLGLANLQSDRFGPPLSYRLYQQNYPNGPMPRAVELKNNIVSSVFENGPWAKLSSAVLPTGPITSPGAGVVVFGWLDQAPPAVDVADNRITQKTTALVYSTLDYGLPANGFLTIPVGLIPGSAVKMPTDGGTCGNGTSIHMSRGTAEFQYLVPGSLKGYQVSKLKLALWRDSGNPVGMPEISLYDWKNQNWVSIQEPIQGTNVIEKAAPYVGQDGGIRLQVTSPSDTFGCIYLDLGLEAQPASGQGE